MTQTTTGIIEMTVAKNARETRPSGVMRMFDFNISSRIWGEDAAMRLPCDPKTL